MQVRVVTVGVPVAISKTALLHLVLRITRALRPHPVAIKARPVVDRTDRMNSTADKDPRGRLNKGAISVIVVAPVVTTVTKGLLVPQVEVAKVVTTRVTMVIKVVTKVVVGATINKVEISRVGRQTKGDHHPISTTAEVVVTSISRMVGLRVASRMAVVTTSVGVLPRP